MEEINKLLHLNNFGAILEAKISKYVPFTGLVKEFWPDGNLAESRCFIDGLLVAGPIMYDVDGNRIHIT